MRAEAGTARRARAPDLEHLRQLANNYTDLSRLRIGASAVHGRGLIASTPFAAGTLAALLWFET